jgi:hypothetical protein
MHYITVNSQRIKLDIINPQTGSLGKEFRLSQIKTDLSVAPKFINKSWKYCYWVIFIYLETNEEFAFYFDFYDKYLHSLNNKEVKKLNNYL